MMRGLGHGRLPPVVHVLHLAQREVGARGVPRTRSSHETSDADAAELLRQHARHPAPSTSSTAGRPRSRSAPRIAATAVAVVGRLRRLRALRARRRATRAPRSTSTPRSTSCRPRDWDGRGAPRAGPSRRTSPGSTRSAAAHPALQRLRNLTSTAPRTTRSSATASAATADDRRDDTSSIVVANVDPHGTRETIVHLEHAGARLRLARDVRRRRRDHRRRRGDGASATTCGSTRPTSRPTSCPSGGPEP